MLGFTADEWEQLSSSQNCDDGWIAQNRTGNTFPTPLPNMAFTMLASVLKSKKAVQMNIAIVTGFYCLADLRYELQRSGRSDRRIAGRKQGIMTSS